MTVCIAALSENGKKVVTIADRMVVCGRMGSEGTIQREGKGRKIIQCADNVVVMQSGNAGSSEWVVSRLKEWAKSRGAMTVEEVYQQIKALALDLTTEMRDRYVRANLGGDFSFSSLARTVSSASSPNHLSVWQNSVQLINSGDFLLTGLDMVGGTATGSIYRVLSTVAPTSVSISEKVESFWAIGCGALHALELLEIYDYNATWSLSSSLYAAYCAKRAAELSPGVDKEIDIKVITEDGIQIPSEKTLKALQDTYEAEWSRRKDPDAYPLVAQAVREMGL